jgi:hypothetical protein
MVGFGVWGLKEKYQTKVCFRSSPIQLQSRHLEPSMTRQELETLWKDPKNRKWGIFYYCKADPRVIVPKRLKWMGWTVNVARPLAIPISLLLISLVAGPTTAVIFMRPGPGPVLLTIAGCTGVVCLLCAYLASRTE